MLDACIGITPLIWKLLWQLKYNYMQNKSHKQEAEQMWVDTHSPLLVYFEKYDVVDRGNSFLYRTYTFTSSSSLDTLFHG